ncbi:nucleotide exchange factor GrpE [Sphaerisporangium perillae]|uniref:nucleotide exchange factor GrpE n=1 Tax=Sphaerisporangium perillae TaxID=2935860 RepID=UPI00200BED30|nr:nucleotide exchange factor GrpE [Sphaerisporangium perillae]
MAPPPEEPHTASSDATSSGEPGLPDAAKELARQVEELTRRLAALAETAGREHDRAAHREQVIDRLHTENQQLRHGLLQEALTPVRAGLYRLHDTVTREAARWQAPDPPAAELAGRLFAAIAEEVAEALGRTGAERAGVKAGDAYDPALHRPAGTRAVEAGADGTVVEVLAEGFAMGERVLRKASVVVGRAAPEGEAAGRPKSENMKKTKKPDKAGNAHDLQQRKDRNDGKDQNAGDEVNGATERAGGGTEKGSE